MNLPYEILEAIAYKIADRHKRHEFVKSLGSDFEEKYYSWKCNARPLPIRTKSFKPRKFPKYVQYEDEYEDLHLLRNISLIFLPFGDGKQYIIEIQTTKCLDNNDPPSTQHRIIEIFGLGDFEDPSYHDIHEIDI